MKSTSHSYCQYVIRRLFAKNLAFNCSVNHAKGMNFELPEFKRAIAAIIYCEQADRFKSTLKTKRPTLLNE